MTSADPSDGVPVLRGIEGWVTGERYVLEPGTSVVIGRSRDCDISLRRIAAYLERAPDQRDGDHDFNTVSRRHVRLSVEGTTVTIEDLSTNGTYCDNQTLGEPRIVDLERGGHALRLGTRESFSLELIDRSQLDDWLNGSAEAKGDAGGDAASDNPDDDSSLRDPVEDGSSVLS